MMQHGLFDVWLALKFGFSSEHLGAQKSSTNAAHTTSNVHGCTLKSRSDKHLSLSPSAEGCRAYLG